MATRNSAERKRSQTIHLAKRAILAQIKQPAHKNNNKRLQGQSSMYYMQYKLRVSDRKTLLHSVEYV